ncbi:hypothetical protein PSYJYH_000074 [Bacillus phage PSYJ-YH]|nr:hypothetical protein PSYJYH_000074 [Bacillus phage PSYJ-YH]
MFESIKGYFRYRRLKKELEVADKRVSYYTSEIVHYSHNYSESAINDLIKMQCFWMDTHKNIVEELLK